jgi:hypothetical protein
METKTGQQVMSIGFDIEYAGMTQYLERVGGWARLAVRLSQYAFRTEHVREVPVYLRLPTLSSRCEGRLLHCPASKSSLLRLVLAPACPNKAIMSSNISCDIFAETECRRNIDCTENRWCATSLVAKGSRAKFGWTSRAPAASKFPWTPFVKRVALSTGSRNWVS